MTPRSRHVSRLETSRPGSSTRATDVCGVAGRARGDVTEESKDPSDIGKDDDAFWFSAVASVTPAGVSQLGHLKTKVIGSPRRRKPSSNMRFVCVSTDAARTNKVSARVWRMFCLTRLLAALRRCDFLGAPATGAAASLRQPAPR
jgi:hypothetical protein